MIINFIEESPTVQFKDLATGDTFYDTFTKCHFMKIKHPNGYSYGLNMSTGMFYQDNAFSENLLKKTRFEATVYAT